MKDIIKVLMSRDDMSEAEAREYYGEVMAEVMDYITSGEYDTAEEIIESDFGLEIDYLLDALI